MSHIERQQTVLEILQGLSSLDALKRLFWQELNYERENKSLSPRQWPDRVKQLLAEDPVLFASGGEDGAFHVVYCRLASPDLNRRLQRPVVNQLLRDHPYVLFVFSNRNQTAWHFLNVKYDAAAEKRRLFRRLTVGPGERLRTATERLSMLDLADIQPDLFGLGPLSIQRRHDQAFDVEAVSQEFFREYRRIFEDTEQSMGGIVEKDRRRLFTQRLFNRLMFIAFIEKKGWLNFDGRSDYLDVLWEHYSSKRDSDGNFYRERLRTLFFSGLNTPHEVDIIGINRGGFLKRIIGNIPYLNGGLFEEDEDDKDSGISVPDGALRTVLRDLFGRFNFTVAESTPLDVDVAVDPEMLGKVFEELVTGRHESGSYYTPKPAVSFMCREGLKGYLQRELPDEPCGAVEVFVDGHDPAGLHQPEAVLDALRRVRACDPACGSGAYLLGLLHELLDLRACLFAVREIDALSVYERKLEIIQNNLYGVDIDAFAVNIARLRLWLSLAVDFEGAKPPPLPNLDFKIETGDSLLGPRVGAAQHAFRDQFVSEFRELKATYMMAHGEEKKRLKKQVGLVKESIAEWTHSEAAPTKVAEPRALYGQQPVKFDWAVEFAEVFQKGGFDLVLANPPWVRQELIRPIKPRLKDLYPEVYSGAADLFVYFFARSLDILSPHGILVLICSSTWTKTASAELLREHLGANTTVLRFADFGDLHIFENVSTYPAIIALAKEPPVNGHNVKAIKVRSILPGDLEDELTAPPVLIPQAELRGKTWLFDDRAVAAVRQKIMDAGATLGTIVGGKCFRGVTTGLNDAFVLDQATRNELVAEDKKSEELLKPFLEGKDLKPWRAQWRGQWLLFVRRGMPIKDYKAAYRFLSSFRQRLEPKPEKWTVTQGEWPGRKAGGYEWYEIQDAVDYYSSFESPKILSTKVSNRPGFSFDDSGFYSSNTSYIIPVGKALRHLVAILNSCVFQFYARSAFVQKQNRYYEIQPEPLMAFPVPAIAPADKKELDRLVDALSGENCSRRAELEAEVNDRVSSLYGFTPEERKVIEKEG